MAIQATLCAHCSGQAALTPELERSGWSCPHCGRANLPPVRDPFGQRSLAPVDAGSGIGFDSRRTLIVVAAAAAVAVAAAMLLVRSGSKPAPAIPGGNGGGPVLSLARAQDRDAQTALRNALVAEKTVYVDAERYATTTTDFDSSGTADLVEIEPSLEFADGDVPQQPFVIFVSLHDGVLYLSARSESGTCFYLRDDTRATGYATDAACRSAGSVSFSPTPW